MIEYIDGELYIGSYSSKELAERFGTPLYIYDAETIRMAINDLKKAFSIIEDFELYYSVKANSNPHIVKLIHSQNLGIETVSVGEVYIALKSGVDPGRIIFTSPGASLEDLKYLADLGVGINANSINQIKLLCRLENKPKEIGIRINTEIASGHHKHVMTGEPHSKFGIPLNSIEEAFDMAETCGIKIVRLHSHIGSGIMDLNPILANLTILLDLASRYESIEEIDIGGGIGVPYREDEKPLPLKTLAEKMGKLIEIWRRDYRRSLKIIMEPGRYIVARSGVLLSRILDVFHRDGKQIVIIESGFNHLIRPALYGSYHRVIPASIKRSRINRGKIETDIYGPLCESGDYIALSRQMPELEIGDLIAIMDVGAYGMVLASTYNSKPLPAEILVDLDDVRIIRYRQEIKDLLRDIPQIGFR